MKHIIVELTEKLKAVEERLAEQQEVLVEMTKEVKERAVFVESLKAQVADYKAAIKMIKGSDR